MALKMLDRPLSGEEYSDSHSMGVTGEGFKLQLLETDVRDGEVSCEPNLCEMECKGLS